ncbi:hypothetical protein FF1_031234 [Malus domestica]
MVKSSPSREREEQKESRPKTSMTLYQRTSFKKTKDSKGFENDDEGFEIILFDIEEFMPELPEGLEEEEPTSEVIDPIVDAAADDGIDNFLCNNVDFMAEDIFSDLSCDGVAAAADSSLSSLEVLMDNVIADYLTEVFDNSNSNESPVRVESREDVDELLEKYIVFP